MIEFTKSYRTSTGEIYATLDEAKKREIELLFDGQQNTSTGWSIDEIAGRLVNNAEKVIDILTTKENSLPKARAINGGRKQRKKQVGVLPPESQTVTTT